MKLDTRAVPRIMAALAVGLCMGAPSVWAQGTAISGTSRLHVPTTVRVPRPAGSGVITARSSSIQGAAWRSDKTPLPNARLRLRSVVTGKVEASTIADGAGKFAFTGVSEGTYLIEVVSDDGNVLMVGQTFTVAPGEAVATFVRLAPKVRWFNGFFNNAAKTVSAIAASAGVTAVAPQVVTPISANR